MWPLVKKVWAPLQLQLEAETFPLINYFFLCAEINMLYGIIQQRVFSATYCLKILISTRHDLLSIGNKTQSRNTHYPRKKHHECTGLNLEKKRPHFQYISIYFLYHPKSQQSHLSGPNKEV